jgi:hypothetical protein
MLDPFSLSIRRASESDARGCFEQRGLLDQ